MIKTSSHLIWKFAIPRVFPENLGKQLFSACRKDQKNYFYGVCKRSNSEVSSQSRFFRGKNVVRVHEITNEAVYSLPNGSFQIYNIFI